MKIPTYRDVIAEARLYRQDSVPERLLRAEEILRRGLADHPYALPIADELAHVLELQGRDDEAMRLLTDQKRRFGGSEETLCRFGKLYKKRAARLRVTSPPRALASLEEAEEAYRHAYELSHSFYPRINQLTMRFLRASLRVTLAPLSESQPLLREVREDAVLLLQEPAIWRPRLDDDNVWIPAMEGETHLLVGNWPNARSAYEEALRAADGREYYLSRMCAQVELLRDGYRDLAINVGSPFDDPRLFFGLPPEGGVSQPLRLKAPLVVETGLAAKLQPNSSVLPGVESSEIHVSTGLQAAATRLVAHQLWPYAPRRESEVAHYVLVGFGATGQALAVELGRLGHFPNRRRSRLTIADVDIESSARAFLARFCRFTSWDGATIGVSAFLPEADDWSWNRHPLPDGIRVAGGEAVQYVTNSRFVHLASARPDERFARQLVDEFAEEAVRPVVIVCGQEDRANFETAIQLGELLTNLGCRKPVPLFVWLPRQPGLAATLDRDKNLFPFGVIQEVPSDGDAIAFSREAIGKHTHEEYVRQNPRLSDVAPVPWQRLSEKTKESNRSAADHLAIKLAAVADFQSHEGVSAGTEAPGVGEGTREELVLAEMEHNRWMAERLLAGWRYGPSGVDDQERANQKARGLSPVIVPWHILPRDEKLKDIQQVRAALKTAAGAIPLRAASPHR